VVAVERLDPLMSPNSSRRLIFLDGLRGIAAMWVVLFHFHEDGRIAALQTALPGWLNTSLFTAGHFGVPIFFVLSGFVIAYAIGDDHVDRRYFGRFALRRLIRLDLPYWASIAITLGYAVVKMKLRPSAADVPLPTSGQIIAHLFYLQDFLHIPNINWVYWTLCFEVQFYLLFCALLGIAYALQQHAGDQRPKQLVFLVAAVVSIAWPLIPALHLPGLALTRFYGFLLGTFACWTLRGTLTAQWFALYALLVGAVGIRTRDSFAAACLVAVAAILLAGRRGALESWLRFRWLQFLGRISYSLYLLHIPVSGAVYFVLGRFMASSSSGSLVAMLLAIAANCLAAQLFWWCVERPSTALSRRVRKIVPVGV
jgi:peptidoglycan/LPS O-acetylase OafA/YrhL